MSSNSSRYPSKQAGVPEWSNVRFPRISSKARNGGSAEIKFLRDPHQTHKKKNPVLLVQVFLQEKVQ